MVKATSRVDRFSKSDIIVSPSILSANFAKLGEQVLFSSFLHSVFSSVTYKQFQFETVSSNPFLWHFHINLDLEFDSHFI